MSPTGSPKGLPFLFVPSPVLAYAHAVEPTHDGGLPDSASPQNQPASGFAGNENKRFGLENLKAFLTKNPEAVFLTLYEIEREYGGDEEGGWWFDWLTPVACVPVFDELSPDGEDAFVEKMKQVWRDAHGANFTGDEYAKDCNGNSIVRPSFWSCSPKRATHLTMWEEVPFSEASHTVPHYE